ncbi:PaRep2b protein [Pyrobaculum oguniense TE7]|uniref:PaRep2b protein n=1 Tax=Pyrobaculum oguniense (strain DSM 13380 / JCM 10595 / TE7) TaxID=698757 RepID=H6Q8W3_PYROT|nr:PaRep2b protein [Pyrobaculum oguniense TE7]
MAEARLHGKEWHVVLYTDSITALRRAEWIEAVKTLVEALHKNEIISGVKKDELLEELAAGPNVVKIAGVKMNVTAAKDGKSERLVIRYLPRSVEAFEAPVKALKEAGFEEGIHFTTRRPEEGEKGDKKPGIIRLKVRAGLWKLEELRRQGVGWAAEAVDKLEEIARARGFYDLLEEYLRPAREAETFDPRGMVAEDPERGIKAVVKDVWVQWEGGRPRVVVEYEANGKAKKYTFIWGVVTGGRVSVKVRLDEEKAAVHAALTGDGSLRGKKHVTLTAKHLLAMAKIKGVGWQLLRWYAEVRGE